ncbi:MAG: hypothetical protein F7C32_00750 [Desulfurococcales archaeon]|nr:hypothetical protein [Desulfurococcales archaeon]
MVEAQAASQTNIEPVTTGLSYIIIPLIVAYGMINGGSIPEELYPILLALAVLPHTTVIAMHNNKHVFGTLPPLLFSTALILPSISPVLNFSATNVLYSSLLIGVVALLTSLREHTISLSLLFLILGIALTDFSAILGGFFASIAIAIIYKKAGKTHAPILAFAITIIVLLLSGMDKIEALYMTLIPLYMFAVIYFLGGSRCPFRGEPELAASGTTLGVLGTLITLYNQPVGFLVWGTGLLVLVSGVLSPSWFSESSSQRKGL